MRGNVDMVDRDVDRADYRAGLDCFMYTNPDRNLFFLKSCFKLDDGFDVMLV